MRKFLLKLSWVTPQSNAQRLIGRLYLAPNRLCPARRRSRGTEVSTSEQEASAELDLSRTVDLAVDHAEVPISHGSIGVTEAGRVGEVEKLGAQLQLHGLANLEVLDKGEIQVANAIATHARVEARGVPRNLVPWMTVG